MQKFLQGLRVVDFSQHIPGPYATLLLAQLGAEVVKVERPGGDAFRNYGPKDSDGISPFYKAMNAGKTIVELDLKRPEDQSLFASMLSKADVLVESFRPGVLARLGFAPAELRTRYSRLVICSVSGYGQTGPNRLRAGHDINYLAFSGMLIGTGSEASPIAPATPVSDFAGGVQASATVMAALVSRGRTGEGAYIDVSMTDTVIAWHSMQLTNATRDGFPMQRANGADTGAAASYRVYATRDDRFVALGAEEPHFWERFCTAVNRHEWIARFDEPMPQSDLIVQVADLFASQPLRHWRAILDEVDCCFEAVLEPPEVSSDPHVMHRQMVHEECWPEPLVQTSYPAWINGQPPARSSKPRYADASSIVALWHRESS